jgi:acetyl-CoA decarbonylase/synthase complex subunit delta
MTSLSDAAEKWTGVINSLTIGATAADGGTRTSAVTVGGANGLPFMNYEGQTPHRPVVAMEIWDRAPDEWPAPLMAALGDAVLSPVDWARRCVEEWGADMLCLKLAGTHPDLGDRSPEEAAQTVRDVLGAVGVPLIIWGSENDEKDNEVLPRCTQAAAGEKCLVGIASEDNYKTLVAACQADGHSLINQSPVDINIAKQCNILVSEMGFPLDRVVMYQTTGALGYGLEYIYSIQERGRLAALGGDKMMSLPVICMVGQEAWRAKEAKATAEEQPTWGDEKTRGVIWELATAATLLQAGSDIIVVRHPATAQALKRVIDGLVA